MSNISYEWKVNGMDCTNCAASITRFLQRKGLENVHVNFATGEVSFSRGQANMSPEEIKAGIHKLGYTVVEDGSKQPFWTLERKLLLSALFTAPLLLEHLLMVVGLNIAALHNPWVQLLLCLPPFLVGLFHFGGSALGSLRGGLPNMDVLIFLGSTAAFIYSLIGTFLARPDYIFYETSATIITLVLLGNFLEKRSVRQTTSAIEELSRLQVGNARRLMPSGAIISVPLEEIQMGDRLLVNEGDQIPADGLVRSGQGFCDESMLTGESEPLEKGVGDQVIGGALWVSGSIQMEATAVGKNTVLSKLIELVKDAQREKPQIQRLADRISAIFVPVVVGISLLTFSLSYFAFDLVFQQALMNSIAVLVISCPCAMGLATPTAVTVGVGRLARNGVLVKGGQTLETFASLRRFVFDKTGTLTNGRLEVAAVDYQGNDPREIDAVIQKLEQHSSHPIARSLLNHFSAQEDAQTVFTEVKEEKGLGMEATDQTGASWRLGSFRTLPAALQAQNGRHSLYLTKDQQLLATVDLKDRIKPEAADTIRYLREQGFEPIILSGDQESKTAAIAAELGVTTYFAEQLPADKLRMIEQLDRSEPTAMIGDGINDAPALAKATIGVSLSDASQAAIQSAQVVLLNGHLHRLTDAIRISRATLQTIRQNLFWAFAYNVVAIPMAALGFLNPMWAAFFMAFSDVVVIGNSIRLRFRKV